MRKTKTNPTWVKGAPFIAILALFVLSWAFYAYIFYQEDKQQPTVNKILRVDNQYELSDTLFFCNEHSIRKKQYYSVYKSDSTQTLRREDICRRCGKDFGSHGTIQMFRTKDLLTKERE
ncbi:MAG: hypothetical protein IJS63_09590 [Bacteroidaceae bacterium]|nr:hypothetical protein [Bacteroidaceae bacterium]